MPPRRGTPPSSCDSGTRGSTTPVSERTPTCRPRPLTPPAGHHPAARAAAPRPAGAAAVLRVRQRRRAATPRPRPAHSGTFSPPIRYDGATPAYIRCTTSPSRRMDEVVAVVRPDPRVVGHERDVVALTVADPQRVHPPRAPRRGYAVARQHHHPVAVQVHRVHLAAGVGDVHAHDVAGGHGEHRHVREQVPVDRPPQPGAAVDEARSGGRSRTRSCGLRSPGRTRAARECRSAGDPARPRAAGRAVAPERRATRPTSADEPPIDTRTAPVADGTTSRSTRAPAVTSTAWRSPGPARARRCRPRPAPGTAPRRPRCGSGRCRC